jgi:hypothetical protein
MKVEYKSYRIVNARTIFRVSLWVIALTVMAVYFWGLGEHRTMYENSWISTVTISTAFFIFTTVGLDIGIRLKHERDKPRTSAPTASSYSFDFPSFGFDLDLGEGIAGVIVGILVWLLFTAVVILFMWLFTEVVLVSIAAFSGMLYWVFFRAMRLIFKNSHKTQGSWSASVTYGTAYTLLYTSWMYVVLLVISLIGN